MGCYGARIARSAGQLVANCIAAAVIGGYAAARPAALGRAEAGWHRLETAHFLIESNHGSVAALERSLGM